MTGFCMHVMCAQISCSACTSKVYGMICNMLLTANAMLKVADGSIGNETAGLEEVTLSDE